MRRASYPFVENFSKLKIPVIYYGSIIFDLHPLFFRNTTTVEGKGFCVYDKVCWYVCGDLQLNPCHQTRDMTANTDLSDIEIRTVHYLPTACSL